MNLTPHFTLAELSHSATATAQGLDNTPDAAAQANLTRLATTILEPIRALLGVPIIITDAYRSPAVNATDGGVAHSQHQQGLAADWVTESDAHPTIPMADDFDTVRRSDIPYDQLILEQGTGTGCIHVSCAADGGTPRREALLRAGSPGAWTYSNA